MQGTLFKETFRRLQLVPNLEEVAKNTNISYFWLVKFKNGHIKDPSVNRIQILFEYLSNNKLKVFEGGSDNE